MVSSSSRPRLVLDSNIWVDLLVFDDPIARPLADALRQQRAIALREARCFDELARVLDYRQFAEHMARRPGGRDAALAEMIALTEPFESARLTAMHTPREAVLFDPADPADPAAPHEPAPPRCRDKDDQKFIELACVARVDWLVSKDRDVLRTARRMLRDFGVRVAPPAVCVAALAELAQPDAGPEPAQADAEAEVSAAVGLDANE